MSTYKTAADNFYMEPDEPSVSYAIIGKAAGWHIEVADVVADEGERTGAHAVILSKRNHRLVIDGDHPATYFKDGLTVANVTSHEDLVNLVLHGPNGGIWQVGAGK